MASCNRVRIHDALNVVHPTLVFTHDKGVRYNYFIQLISVLHSTYNAIVTDRQFN